MFRCLGFFALDFLDAVAIRATVAIAMCHLSDAQDKRNDNKNVPVTSSPLHVVATSHFTPVVCHISSRFIVPLIAVFQYISAYTTVGSLLHQALSMYYTKHASATRYNIIFSSQNYVVC